MLFAPPLRAIAQLDDPVFLKVLLQSLAWAAACFVALVVLAILGARYLIEVDPGHWWLGWLVGVLGGAGALLLAHYFFLSIAVVIATLFIDPIADAVERRFYPGMPSARPAPLAAQVWDGIALGLRVLALQLVGLVLAIFLPGIGALLGWVIAAWAIGRGMFVAVAMRRMDRGHAIAVYQGMRLPVLAQGALMTLGGLVPLLNLAIPVLGAAAMVHVLHAPRRDGG